MDTYDVAIVGVGAMGAAAAATLAERGARVIGFEQFDVPNERGSSSGSTRIMRRGYFEHPDYVPLLERAELMWGAMEAQSPGTYLRCGVLFGGAPHGAVVRGLQQAIERHGLALSTLAAAEVTERWPAIRWPEGRVAFYESGAGVLRPERAVRSMIAQATAAGAALYSWEPVVEWKPDGDMLVVGTPLRTVRARRLVVCAGGWTAALLQSAGLPLTVRRKMMLWCETRSEAYRIDRPCPAIGLQDDRGQFDYCTPDMGDGTVKVARHTGGRVASTPARVERCLRASDVAEIAPFVQQVLADASTDVRRYAACLYTVTPDEHFIVDRHPSHPGVLVAAGFSGHGFKFAPVIGQALADLALDGHTALPIGFLRWSRFAT